MDIVKDFAQKLRLQEKYNDAAFLERCYTTPQEIYLQRLKAINFQSLNTVLDAGSGFGQWSFALAELNKQVDCFDISDHRIEFIKEYAQKNSITNITPTVTALPNLNYKNEQFDAIFSYGVIFCTPWKESLQEFYRILKPKGKVYFSCNGLGYTISRWIKPYNEVTGFNPKDDVWKFFRDTALYEQKTIQPEVQLIINKEDVITLSRQLGFSVISIEGEGKINITNTQPEPKSFFPDKFHGFDCCYEVLLEKN